MGKNTRLHILSTCYLLDLLVVEAPIKWGTTYNKPPCCHGGAHRWHHFHFHSRCVQRSKICAANANSGTINRSSVIIQINAECFRLAKMPELWIHQCNLFVSIGAKISTTQELQEPTEPGTGSAGAAHPPGLGLRMALPHLSRILWHIMFALATVTIHPMVTVKIRPR